MVCVIHFYQIFDGKINGDMKSPFQRYLKISQEQKMAKA